MELTPPSVALFGILKPDTNYEYYIKVKCGNSTLTSTTFYFNTFIEPLLALDTSDDLFAQKLAYKGSNIEKNGWQTFQRKSNNNNLDKEPFQTKYTYDALNRMLTAKVDFPVHNGNYNVGVAYDLNGNIKTLTRKSRYEGNIDAYLDNLTYTYHSSMNRLMNIVDAGDTQKGHVRDSGGNTYDYYNDGSVKIDRSKRVFYQYNHLNMPERMIKLDNAGNATDNFIEIAYLANGEKLSMHTFKNNVEVNSVYYRDNVEIRNNDVIVNHSDGRVVYTNGGGTGDYQYYLKDHLGNVRLTFAECGEVVAGGCKSNDVQVIDENHYYPFGLKMEGYWNDFNSETAITTNQYNGKEWVDDLGLAMNDYGARWYDPAVARWNSVDPLAEKYVGHSPYNYVLGNPVKYIDPDGRTVYESKSLGLSVEVQDGVDKHLFVNESDFEVAFYFANLITDSKGIYDKELIDLYNQFYWNLVSYDGFSLSNLHDYFHGGPKLFDGEPIGGPIPGFEYLYGGGLKAAKILSKSNKASKIDKTTRMVSIVKNDAILLKLSRQTFQGNKLLGKEANQIISQLSKGNLNPGIGTKNIGKGIFESRSSNGARIYFKNSTNSIQILGYSNKHNQRKVIKRLLKIY